MSIGCCDNSMWDRHLSNELADYNENFGPIPCSMCCEDSEPDLLDQDGNHLCRFCYDTLNAEDE